VKWTILENVTDMIHNIMSVAELAQQM